MLDEEEEVKPKTVELELLELWDEDDDEDRELLLDVKDATVLELEFELKSPPDDDILQLA